MKKIFSVLIGATAALLVVSTPVFAESCVCKVQQPDGTIKEYPGEKPATSILNESACDCSKEGGPSAITNILNLVVQIMSIGVGILGVVGITIVGIQYLTAGGNEEKTRKAKRRLIEILIGLAVYAVMAALLTWLGVSNGSETSKIKSGTTVAVIE